MMTKQTYRVVELEEALKEIKKNVKRHLQAYQETSYLRKILRIIDELKLDDFDDFKFLCQYQHFIPFGKKQRCLHPKHLKRNPWVYPLCEKSMCPLLNRNNEVE